MRYLCFVLVMFTGHHHFLCDAMPVSKSDSLIDEFVTLHRQDKVGSKKRLAGPAVNALSTTTTMSTEGETANADLRATVEMQAAQQAEGGGKDDNKDYNKDHKKGDKEKDDKPLNPASATRSLPAGKSDAITVVAAVVIGVVFLIGAGYALFIAVRTRFRPDAAQVVRTRFRHEAAQVKDDLLLEHETPAS